MEEIIMVKNEEGRTFDKMKIAIAIRDSTYNDKLSCSLISNEVININIVNFKCIDINKLHTTFHITEDAGHILRMF